MCKENSEITVSLVEDFEVDINGIGNFIINSGFNFNENFIYKTYNEAVEGFLQNSIDVVLIDLKIPEYKNGVADFQVGLKLIERVITEFRKMKVLAIARDFNCDHIYRLMRNGIGLYTKSNITQSKMENIIHSVMNNDVIYSECAAPILCEALQAVIPFESDDIDKQIVRLILEGKTDLQIADEVHLSEDGVGARLQNFYKKTDIHNRKLLAKWFESYIMPPNWKYPSEDV